MDGKGGHLRDGNTGDFAAGPVVKTPSFHCKGVSVRLIPCQGTKIPHAVQDGKKCIKKKTKNEISKNLEHCKG